MVHIHSTRPTHQVCSVQSKWSTGRACHRGPVWTCKCRPLSLPCPVVTPRTPTHVVRWTEVHPLDEDDDPSGNRKPSEPTGWIFTPNLQFEPLSGDRGLTRVHLKVSQDLSGLGEGLGPTPVYPSGVWRGGDDVKEDFKGQIKIGDPYEHFKPQIFSKRIL